MAFVAATPGVIHAGLRIVVDCLDDSFLMVVEQVVGLVLRSKYRQYVEDL